MCILDGHVKTRNIGSSNNWMFFNLKKSRPDYFGCQLKCSRQLLTRQAQLINLILPFEKRSATKNINTSLSLYLKNHCGSDGLDPLLDNWGCMLIITSFKIQPYLKSIIQ